MKRFSQLVQEAIAPSARVVLFGRMNPPTRGHEENVLAAHKVAQKHNAPLHIISSHSQDNKKNPLSVVQKTRYLKHAFGHLENTSIGTSSHDEPSVLHQAVAAHKAGVRHFIMAGGGDRASGYHKLLKQYNGVANKPHGYYKFDKITVANTGARKEGISGTVMRRHASSGNYEKFKQNLPSKIQGNERHAKDLYQHVQKVLTQKEELTREDYVQGLKLQLGTSVMDSQTGLTGKIVYRGPTYVTVQIDESLSFKRWIADVEVEDQDTLPQDPTLTFKNFVESYPNDVQKELIDSLHLCPGAQTEFSRLLNDDSKDQNIVLKALVATRNYLNIEELGLNNPQRLTQHAIDQFAHEMLTAMSLLMTLNDLAAHESYMEQHADTVKNLVQQELQRENVDMDRFKNFITETQGAIDPDLPEKYLADIEQNIDQLQWHDINYLYTEPTSEFMFDLDEAELSAVQRMKKKMQFMKSRAKREIARRIALKRMSTQGKIKKKSIVHARKMLMQRLLRGRDKSKLSAAEKSRIETLIDKNKLAVVRISNRLIPKIRELEQARLKHMREEIAVIDIENSSVTASYAVNQVIQHLSGTPPTLNDAKPNAAHHVNRMRQFRKMEG